MIKELFSGADKTNQRLLSSIHAYNRDSDRIVSKVIRYVSCPNFAIENMKWSKLDTKINLFEKQYLFHFLGISIQEYLKKKTVFYP